MRKLGFTLAEVLITLVIIGVIAAMTIPTLMGNTGKEELRVGLKKAISAASQALTMQYAREGLTAQDYTSTSDLVENLFKKRMVTMEAASTFTNDQVCTQGTIFATADGIIYCVSKNFSSNASQDGDATICDSNNEEPCAANASEPNLWIDVNGAKKPNSPTVSAKNPKDIYQAMIYAQKIVPFGVPTQEVMFDSGK